MEPTITIRGHVGNEPEHIVVGNTSKVTFRVAHTHRFRRGQDAEWEDAPTVWLTVECWRHLAANVLASVRRGEPVVVVGRLRTQEWESNGEPRSRVVLQADTVGHDLNRGRASFTRIGRAAASREGQDEGAGTDEVSDDATEEPMAVAS